MKYILFLSLFFSSVSIIAQDLRLGQWKSHLPYRSGQAVTQSAEKVFFADALALFSIDKDENSIDFFTKVNGLSDVGISTIRYNPNNDILLVAYKNSNIDLLKPDNSTVNLGDINRSTISGDKTIYHILFDGNFAYLSCGFGLLKLDMIKEEVRFTTLTNGIRINASTIFKDALYISTENGVYSAPLNQENLNLSDFANWKEYRTEEGLPDEYHSNVITTFKDKLYADIGDTLQVFDGTTWTSIDTLTGINRKFESLEAGIDRLVLCIGPADLDIPAPSDLRYIYENGNRTSLFSTECIGQLRQAIQDENGEIWVADAFNGMGHSITGFTCSSIEFNAPYSKNINEIAVHNDEVWIASGSVTILWNFTDQKDGTFSLKNGQWESYNRFNRTELEGTSDHIRVAIHPSNGHVYVGSFGQGLIDINGEDITIHTVGTGLEPQVNTDDYKITGLAFDSDKNLWISNYLADRPISVYKADGAWQSFTHSSLPKSLTDVIVDENGYKWFLNASGGIVVFDEGDMNDPTDNRYKTLTISNSNLPTNDVNDIAMDLEGDIWVGTKEGVIVFDCAFAVFEQNSCAGRLIRVEADDFGAHLLASETVKAVAVDGANRKWFGTDNGVFVLSPNGIDQIHRFNESNSPLFSNQVVDIAINHNNGEVFIGTINGLISYRSEAIKGGFTHKEEVYAFPNPVRPEYTGNIAIKGLVQDANVKITDIRGTMIYETTALGGQAIWNGKDYNNRRASSGVYLVFSSNKNGTQTLVTKLLLLK